MANEKQRPGQGAAPPRTAGTAASRRGALTIIGIVVAAVAVIVAVFVFGGTGDDAGTDASGDTVAPDALAAVTSVPVATLDAVGVPDAPRNVNPLPPGTPAVEVDGKPVVLYFGAEFCPFCAVQRWPVVVALSRFGTFTGLEATTSAPPPEVLPNTPTPTFHGATYASDHLVFSAVETATRDFQPLDTPTPLQEELFATYNVADVTGSNGGIPFMMIGNLYAWAGSQYDPSVLDGKSFDEIAADLADPDTAVARAVGGTANYLTAMICRLTGDQPSDVCSDPVISRAQLALPGS